MSFEGSQFFSLRVVPSYESQRSFPLERRDVSVLPYKVVISSAAVPKPREKALRETETLFGLVSLNAENAHETSPSSMPG